jgi:predicted Zn-dependent protease
MPPRLPRPELSGEEGGLWAMMDREEARLRRSPFRLRLPEFDKYLADIACQLAADHCPDIRVYVMRTPYVNASMAPNGMLQMWSGLLLRLENEAQLAAIVAHEIGHYVQRHSLEQMRDAKARAAFGTAMAAAGLVGLVGLLLAVGGAYAFSRDQERDADRISVVLMRSNGYDTREAPKVWTNLLDELKANPDNDPSLDSVLFATHPSSEERRAELQRLASQAGGRTAAEEYRARLAPLRYGLLEDEIKRGRPAESKVLLDRLLAGEPGSAELLYFRGEALRHRDATGDKALALADFDAALRTGQAPAATYRSLGALYQSMNQPVAARDAWQQYLRLAPDAPDAALIQQATGEIK